MKINYIAPEKALKKICKLYFEQKKVIFVSNKLFINMQNIFESHSCTKGKSFYQELKDKVFIYAYITEQHVDGWHYVYDILDHKLSDGGDINDAIYLDCK